jgi:hypothetical protein
MSLALTYINDMKKLNTHNNIDCFFKNRLRQYQERFSSGEQNVSWLKLYKDLSVYKKLNHSHKRTVKLV